MKHLKKILSAFVPVLALVLALSACGAGTVEGPEPTETPAAQTAEPAVTDASAGAEQTGEQTVGMANPVTEYASLDEINDAAGVNLVRPDADVTDESFSVIGDDLAQYCFTLDGVPYTFRADTDTETDISGVYSGGALLTDSLDQDGYAADADGRLCCWVTTVDGTDVQYVLYARDGGTLERADFLTFAAGLMDRTLDTVSLDEAVQQFYALLEGEYSDESGVCASASVVNQGDGLRITVVRQDDETHATVWTMTAVYDSARGLPYSDCVQKTVVTDADGKTVSEETLSQDGTGNFTVAVHGNLQWDGAEDEACRACVFAKNG